MNRKPRILIDARMLLGRFSGVSRYVARLIRGLAQQDQFQVIALCGNEQPAELAQLPEIEFLCTSFSRRDRRMDRRACWEARNLRRAIRESRADLYHATWNTGIPLCCPVPAILTIHDLIPLHEVRTTQASRMQYLCYRYSLAASIRRAARIVTVSDFVRDDLLATFRATPAHKVQTVHNGVDEVGPGAARQKPRCPFVLYVGGHEPRKNVAAILRSMRHWWSRHGFTMELWMTGEAADLAPDALAEFRRRPHTAPVRFLGSPNDAQLAGCYRQATALLLLSRDEGFGLPPLEAMAHGCSVIVSDQASLPEVVGDAGLIVNGNDAEAVARALDRILDEPALRSELVRRGYRRAREFSWDRAVARLTSLYSDLAAGPAAADADSIPTPA